MQRGHHSEEPIRAIRGVDANAACQNEPNHDYDSEEPHRTRCKKKTRSPTHMHRKFTLSGIAEGLPGEP